MKLPFNFYFIVWLVGVVLTFLYADKSITIAVLTISASNVMNTNILQKVKDDHKNEK